MNRTAIVCTSIASLCVLGSVAMLTAGPLDPPAGPVAPTYKTLSEVEPRIAIGTATTPGDTDSVYKITIPGSYYLTGNVVGAAGKMGIEILTSGVTIDLMGFRLQGAVGSLDGIATSGGIRGQIVVRNGTVSAWGGAGIDLTASGVGSDCTVENVHAITNQGIGIVVCNRSIVRSCVARGNVGGGIASTAEAVVDGCVAALNTTSGIAVGASSVVRGCSARENGGAGISVASAGVVSECASFDNGGTGIAMTSGASVRACTSYSNGGSGISTTSGGFVESCTVSLNDVHGILLGSDSIARGNLCDSNGAATTDSGGIFTAGSNSRIEANNCTDNDYGIRVSGTTNVIARNTCSFNISGNWNVVAGNCINVYNAQSSPKDITTNAGGIPFASRDDPNANYTYGVN